MPRQEKSIERVGYGLGKEQGRGDVARVGNNKDATPPEVDIKGINQAFTAHATEIQQATQEGAITKTMREDPNFALKIYREYEALSRDNRAKDDIIKLAQKRLYQAEAMVNQANARTQFADGQYFLLANRLGLEAQGLTYQATVDRLDTVLGQLDGSKKDAERRAQEERLTKELWSKFDRAVKLVLANINRHSGGFRNTKDYLAVLKPMGDFLITNKESGQYHRHQKSKELFAVIEKVIDDTNAKIGKTVTSVEGTLGRLLEFKAGSTDKENLQRLVADSLEQVKKAWFDQSFA